MQKWTRENIAHVLELADSGLGSRRIAKQMNVTHNAVAGVLRRHRPTLPSGMVTTLDLDSRLNWQRVIATGGRWIEGDPGVDDDWQWCGQDRVGTSSYCREHTRRAGGLYSKHI